MDETHSSSVFVRDERAAEDALDGVVHPDARLEEAERPEARLLLPRALPAASARAHGKRERGYTADDRGERDVQCERGGPRRCAVPVNGYEGVQERAEHHRDHKVGKDVAEWERGGI